jgi:hypothetical protein
MLPDEQDQRNLQYQELKKQSEALLAHKTNWSKSAAWKKAYMESTRHLLRPIPLSDAQKAILEESRRLLAAKPPERCKVALARELALKRNKWRYVKEEAKRHLEGHVPLEQREQRSSKSRNSTMSSQTTRRNGASDAVNASTFNTAIARAIDSLRSELRKEFLQLANEKYELMMSATGEALKLLLDDIEETGREELATEIKGLKIEIASLEAVVQDLRAIIASERAKVIDENYNTSRRPGMN